MDWKPYQDGDTIGKNGSENGIIFPDDEFDQFARITIEECPKYFAITCGVGGWLVHTRFFKEKAKAEQECELMKVELEKIVDITLTEKDNSIVSDKMFEFVKKFP